MKLRLPDLEHLAAQSGYVDYRTMLYELYSVQGLGIGPLARRLHIPAYRLRKHLKRFGITIHGRGGDHGLSTVVLTSELVQEITKDGVPAVAARLGCAQSILYAKLKALVEKAKT